VENSIILAEWFDACVDAHEKLGFKPLGAKIVSHDPSDLGPDDKGLCLRHGSVILDAMAEKYGDVNEGCDWATGYAADNNADWFTWDGDGLGVSLRRQIQEAFEGTKTEVEMFRGSNSPENPDSVYQEPGKVLPDDAKRRTNRETFRNLRSQRYWMLRDRVFNTYQAVTKNQYIDPDQMISFSSKIQDIQKLRSELCRIPRKPNSRGLIQIMTKDEMKRLLKIESPNIADAVMMSLMTPKNPVEMQADVNRYISRNKHIRRGLRV
jgi:phage terminase large subunit